MNRKLANEELGRPDLASYKQQSKNPVILVLDNIRSLNNIGSVFRTADAFAVEAIYLCGITAQPPHREINKTALGATESVDWHYFEQTEEAIEALKAKHYKILAVEQAEQSTLLHDFKATNKQGLALVFGHEVKGVQQSIVDAADQVIEIPQQGTKHSFNISVSVGIVLWEVLQKINTK